MPSSIPYDSNLSLANIVHPEILANVEAIAKIQAPADAAEATLNSLISLRRKLDMTKADLMNLGVDTAKFQQENQQLTTEIKDAAVAYAIEKIKSSKEIAPLRAKITAVHSDLESPVDYLKTGIKRMPLSVDSLNMDVQYFSRDENSQDSTAFAASVSGYIAAATGWLGEEASTHMRHASGTQLSKQLEKHSISGTLVFSVNCTHKNAVLLAPFVLNVDKGIKVWNGLFPDKKIKMDDPKAVQELANQDATDSESHFSIISGVTYGSSFVGMVHVLDTTDTKVSQRMSKVASTLQAQMDAGSWFEKESGGFGVSETIADDVKNLLSSNSINSHVTILSVGIIPSIVSNDVLTVVKEFSDFSPDKMMQNLATLANVSDAEQTSVQSSAREARLGGQLVAMQNSNITAAVNAVGKLDARVNKMIDVNSMMKALEDFLKKAIEGESGVPVNYYLKRITAPMLAQMWVAKYLPGKYLTLQNDDSGGSAEPEPQPQPQPQPEPEADQ